MKHLTLKPNLVHAASRVTSTFDFDSGGNRARQTKERTAANDSRVIEYTLYLGSYERESHWTKANAGAAQVLQKTLHRHSLGGGVVYTRTVGGPAPGVKLMNVLADHLGSTDVILTGKWNGSTFANHTTERQSFDAWGERRAADTQVNFRATDSDAFRTSAQDYDRGYTSHEQLDDSGLIHMNGRIYDPELGRFLAPDPYVQIPEYSQNFNRYSYVLNNPLNATDPSGFSFIGKIFGKLGNWIKENWRMIVVIVVVAILTLTPGGQAFIGPAVGWLSATASISTAAATGAVVGSIAGGLSAALAGGDLGDILRGAIVGGIQGGISGGILHGMEDAAINSGAFWDKAAHVAGHGVVGGASNVAMGGKFQDGFLSAAASAYAGWTFLKNTTISQTIGSTGYGRTAIAGVVGGTASVLGGGKFANGAYTAAFQHLLNSELQKRYRAAVTRKAQEAENSIITQIESGANEITLSQKQVRSLMLYDLIRIRDSQEMIKNMSLAQFRTKSRFADGVFKAYFGYSFNITKNAPYSSVPVGKFLGSDINYAFYGMFSEIKVPWLGQGVAESANLFWNAGEAILGNDLKGGKVPHRQSIGQISPARPWADYGVHLQRHHLAN